MMKSPIMSIAREGRIKELDGWRAISVLLVIAHHIGAYQYAALVVHPHHRIYLLLSRCGPRGVKVFFEISGFVICRLLILEERRCAAVSLRGFYLRRVFRILPPYCLYLATICLLLLLQLIAAEWRMISRLHFFYTTCAL